MNTSSRVSGHERPRIVQGQVRSLLALTVVTILLATAGAFGGQDDPVATLVDRAGRYVQEYEKQFSAVVCEEHQTQRVLRADGRARKRRDLRSDVLLVKTGEKTVMFRDVIAVDGKAVRDRQERLRKLFLDAGASRTAMRQARAIGDESARYNIGFSRGLDALMVPLEILQPRTAPGFRFSTADQGLAFQEFQSPSLIRYRSGQGARDMFLNGRFTLDADTGRVRAANLKASNPVFELTLDVRYVEDPKVELLVPADMQEQYRHAEKPEEDWLEVSSTYANYRRFQVTVNERIEEPK